jgi:hypothetical protein
VKYRKTLRAQKKQSQIEVQHGTQGSVALN